jgi:hypothetical protein
LRSRDPLGHSIPYWKADTDVIIEYLLEKWPKKALNRDDMGLNDYFYDVPAILWNR